MIRAALKQRFVVFLALLAVSSSVMAQRRVFTRPVSRSIVRLLQIDGARSAREVHSRLLIYRFRLAACQSPMNGFVVATIEISESGQLRVVRTRLSDDDEQRTPGQCVTQVLEAMHFPQADGTTTAQVHVQLSDGLPTHAAPPRQ